jgi:hypothetical protein
MTEDAERHSLKMTAHKGSGSSSRPNAFTLLMKNAFKQGDTKQAKDQGKGATVSQKIEAVVKSNDAKAKAKAEPQARRIPLKNRMRRNEKPKPLVPTKFVPVIFDEDEDQGEMAEPGAKEISPTPEENFQTGEETVPHVESIVSTPPPSHESPTIPPPSTKQPVAAAPMEAENRTVPRPSSSPTPAPPLSNPEFGTNVHERPATPPAVVHEGQAEHGGEAYSVPMPTEHKQSQDPLLEEHNVEVHEVSAEEQIRPTPQPEPVFNTSTEQVAPSIRQKPTTRKRARSIVPSSGRVTRSAMKPPQPPLKPTTGRRKQNSVFVCIFSFNHRSPS